MRKRLTALRITVLAALLLLLAAWLAANLRDFVSVQNGLIRLVLGTAFFVLIILRQKPPDGSDTGDSVWQTSGFAIVTCGAGTAFALIGIVFDVGQVEWVGMLLLIAGSMIWVAPKSYGKDIFLAMLLFYWIHPLPGTVFGPMQIAMQRMSVTGAEHLLHILNVRVWADGLILRTGLNVYEIPAWCSGMRTATTVFILALGLGIIQRLKWYQCGFVMVLGVIQALALNILRITAMVMAGPFAEKAADIKFLHDATGIIIIGAILLVWLEISMMRKVKRESKAVASVPNWMFLKKLSGYPPFWRIVVRHRGKLTLMLLLFLFIVVTAYKSRPFHRVEMLKPVVKLLVNTGELENAERLAASIRKLVPSDHEWMLEIARIYIMRGKYDDTLNIISLIPDGDSNRNIEKNVLTAYSYIGLQNIPKAAEIMENIPDDIKEQSPLVAMVMAEIGMFSNNPGQTAKYITIAKEWKPNTDRIRRLYPYLRTYRKWDAIGDSNVEDILYSDINQALCAIDAYIHKNDTVAISAITLHITEKWPTDMRALTPLFFMTIKRDNPEWEDRFAEHLRRCVAVANDPEYLYPLFENCFRIARPDLAWVIYQRIEELDPTHPSLYLYATRFGHSWFVFRKLFLGMSTNNMNETIDARYLFVMSEFIPLWREVVSHVPLGSELSALDIQPSIYDLTNRMLDEFKLREDSDKLSNGMRMEYVRALEAAGRRDEASALLVKYAKVTPEAEVKTIISEMSEELNDWQNVYETLYNIISAQSSSVDSTAEAARPVFLSLLIRLSQSQRGLRLGIAAIESAREAVRIYPESEKALHNLVMTLMAFDSPEEALIALNKGIPYYSRDLDSIKTRVLYRTERFSAAKELSDSTLIQGAAITSETRQSIVLQPAELALHYHEATMPSASAFEVTAGQIEANLKITTSPYLYRLLALWLEVYSRSEAGDATQDVQAWLSIGRTSAEKAVALHQLATLLCYKKDFEGARLAIMESVKHLPNSAILWRMLISLSAADREVIRKARINCPDDSEIWLADLVAATQQDDCGLRTKDYGKEKEGGGLGGASASYDLAEFEKYSSAALTRAAEYLLRVGRNKDASVISKHAVAKAQSLLPAYVIGVRCALRDKDDEMVLKCLQGCMSSAVTPIPAFYETLVDMKTEGYDIDTDLSMIDALQNLRKQDSGNRLWAEMLGYVQFMRGGEGLIDAMFHLTSAINSGTTNKYVFILASETARQLGNLNNAGAILESGLQYYPNDRILLNNLVYTLAQSEATAQEALKYIPELLELAGNDPRMLDTAATAFLSANQLDKAEDIFNLLLKRNNHIPEYWFRSNMKLAEIAMRRDNTAKAKTLLSEILKNTRDMKDEDVKKASKLLESLNPQSTVPNAGSVD